MCEVKWLHLSWERGRWKACCTGWCAYWWKPIVAVIAGVVATAVIAGVFVNGVIAGVVATGAIADMVATGVIIK